MWLEEVERLLGESPVRRLPEGHGLAPAAVLVPLYVAAGELWVLLTRRAGSPAEHPGQLAFPGGARTPEDYDEVAAALREAAEEIGLDPSAAVVLGHLDDVDTANGFAISPVVAAIPFPNVLHPASAEVEALAPVPFTYLANPEAVEEQETEAAGRRVVEPVLHYRSHRIWGPTARVVADLVARLSGGRAAAGR